MRGNGLRFCFGYRYPTVASGDDCPFPVGAPRIIINPVELARIYCKSGGCFLKAGKPNGDDMELHGIAQVKVLAPDGLEIPFLPFRYLVFHILPFFTCILLVLL